MAIRFSARRAALAATALLAVPAGPALACGTCGCGLPGSSSEVSSISGSATLFAAQGKFLVQSGLSFRDITGSFNERSTWFEKPAGSSLTTLQGNLGLTYYPVEGLTLGLQVPMALNRLAGAQWGTQGSINPVDEEDGVFGPQSGGGVGDITLQGSYVALRGEDFWPSLALWGGLVLPSGNAAGNPASFTGSGVLSGQVGLSLLRSFGSLEVSASAGYQRPLTQPPQDVSSAFYVGQSLLGQLQANLEVAPGWRLGLGASTFYGEIGATDVAPTASRLGKLKLIPSVEWQFAPEQGVRLAYGADPGIGPWMNSMTDRTLFAVYYRYL